MRDPLLWLPGCIFLGLLVAWAAVDAQFYFAPLLLFPILVGVLLGALLVLLMRMAQIGHRPTIVCGTILAAGLTIWGMHYLTYLSNRRTAAAESANLEKAQRLQPEFAALRLPAPPDNFFQYMKEKAVQGRRIFHPYYFRGVYAWLLWSVEALLLTAATLLVAIPAMYLPFCRQCHSWYRTIRSARLPPGVFQQLADVLNLETTPRLRSCRCRLLACLGGCGPTGCELAWEDLEGKTSFARVWLHPEQRNGIVETLDRYAEEGGIVNSRNPDHGTRAAG
ncbi:MAG: hypothetical protein JXB10_09570 [Pirellulales bacterium]|nr:hypothetical protein [Pirellulales bacterium]